MVLLSKESTDPRWMTMGHRGSWGHWPIPSKMGQSKKTKANHRYQRSKDRNNVGMHPTGLSPGESPHGLKCAGEVLTQTGQG